MTSLASRRVLQRLADFDYVEGDYRVLPRSAPEESDPSDLPRQLAWWDFSAETDEYRGWKASTDKVLDYIRKNGPFDGILGFSQGAALTLILCALQHRQGDAESLFKFVIMCGGFVPRDPDIRGLLPAALETPSLHIIGDSDETVPARNSIELAALFKDPDIYRHEKGHLIPTNAPAAQRYRQFLSRFATLSPVSSL